MRLYLDNRGIWETIGTAGQSPAATADDVAACLTAVGELVVELGAPV